jgi:Uma2 family endonuclease
MALEVRRRRFTTAEYHRIAEAGVLSEDDRVELIEGEILEMNPIGSKHASCVKRLTRLFTEKLGDKVIVGVQDPVQVGEYSEPQPDVALLRSRPDFYAAAHPRPNDVLLLIEVADTTLEYDEQVKAPLYGHSGVHETWLVDLERDVLMVHLDPSPTGYERVRVLRRSDFVRPSAFPHLEIAVAGVLG